MAKLASEFYKVDKDRPTRVIGSLKKFVEKGRQGQEGNKYRASVQVLKNGAESEVLPFFVKDISRGYNIHHEGELEAQQLKWQRLRKLGLPVVNTFRIDADRNQILMTDLSERGQKKIFDTNHKLPENFRKRIKDEQELLNNLKEIAIKAFDNGNGVLLSMDAYALVFDQFGDFEIKLIDIGIESYLLEEGNAEYSLGSKQKITQQECLEQAEAFIFFVVEGLGDPNNMFWGG